MSFARRRSLGASTLKQGGSVSVGDLSKAGLWGAEGQAEDGGLAKANGSHAHQDDGEVRSVEPPSGGFVWLCSVSLSGVRVLYLSFPQQAAESEMS